MMPITVAKDMIVQSRIGRFKHADILGLKFGSRIRSVDGLKHAVVLRPTPELWTRALPHRTQILYLADISFILRKLDIRPGSTVIESGTGSGSFSHSVARSVFPSGRLLTFEFHAERAEKARNEFSVHELADFVVIEQRDVISSGFGQEDVADAVFLDLPATWEAIAWAKIAMRKDGQSKICCYSPCFEQVLKNFGELRRHSFVDIQMYEVLTRDYELLQLGPRGSISSHTRNKRHLDEHDGVRPIAHPSVQAKGHTSYLTFARLPLTALQ